MSSQNGHGAAPGTSHGKEDEDRIDFAKVVAVGVVSLVVFALSTWWAISILHTERAALKGRAEGHAGAELGRPEIGIVDQVPFEGDTRLQNWRAERSSWLGGYGWVDRAKGVIHIPIDRAMDQVVAGVAPPIVPGMAPPPAAQSAVVPPATTPAPAGVGSKPPTAKPAPATATKTKVTAPPAPSAEPPAPAAAPAGGTP